MCTCREQNCHFNIQSSCIFFKGERKIALLQRPAQQKDCKDLLPQLTYDSKLYYKYNVIPSKERDERKNFFPLKKSKNTYFERYCAKKIHFRDCHVKKCKILANSHVYGIGGKLSLVSTVVKLVQSQEFCKMSLGAFFCLLTFTCMEKLLNAALFMANETLICNNVRQYLHKQAVCNISIYIERTRADRVIVGSTDELLKATEVHK